MRVCKGPYLARSALYRLRTLHPHGSAGPWMDALFPALGGARPLANLASYDVILTPSPRRPSSSSPTTGAGRWRCTLPSTAGMIWFKAQGAWVSRRYFNVSYLKACCQAMFFGRAAPPRPAGRSRSVSRMRTRHTRPSSCWRPSRPGPHCRPEPPLPSARPPETTQCVAM
jgi:hypothetical protein